MTKSSANGSGDLITRLYSVARGLEDEGQNNIAKLFRAAALGEMYRSSQDRPRQGAGLEEEMRSVVDEMSSRDSTSKALKSAMGYSIDAFERGDWPLLTDIPKTWVCRFCGEVMLGESPERCPTCQSRRITFQESLPVFYLDPMEPDEIAQALGANLSDIEHSVDGVSEEQADQGVWPMREILSHLLEAQELMVGRAKRMLAEDNPNLGSVPPSEIGKLNADGPREIADMLEAFRSTRQDAIEMVRSASDQAFARPGYHPEWGPLTVLSQLTYMVRHEGSHLAEMQDRREGR
jgi:RNA polymerase subunit RPABC4/transcription elongation factor Spt4